MDKEEFIKRLEQEGRYDTPLILQYAGWLEKESSKLNIPPEKLYDKEWLAGGSIPRVRGYYQDREGQWTDKMDYPWNFEK